MIGVADVNRSFFIRYCCLIVIMVFTCFVSYKVMASVIDKKDNSTLTVNENKLDDNVLVNYEENYELQKYYNDNNLDQKIVDFSNCLHSYMSTEVKNNSDINYLVTELENYYNSDSNNFAFYYFDLNTGFSVSYNKDQKIYGASVLKAPFVIYIYKEASLNNVNLDEKMTYTKDFYTGGSGIIQNEEFGKVYSIKDLCYYAIVESDNIAYKMLASRFDINDVKDFWNKLNVNSIYENNVLFSSINATDAVKIMKYLYDFSLENDYGKELMSVFTTAKYNFIPKDGLIMAHKSGWANTSIHDMTIKFDENPYILIVLSKRGEIEFQSLFDFTSEKISKIHEIFWNENVNYCLNDFKN